jgi:hypothetical protein
LTDASVPASGSVFPIGTTTMNDDAKASTGNHSSCRFMVHAKDAAEQITDQDMSTREPSYPIVVVNATAASVAIS